MLIISQRWMRRSRMAVVMVASPRKSAHSSKPLLFARILHSLPAFGNVAGSGIFKKPGLATLPNPVFCTVDLRQSCQKSIKIGSYNFVKPDSGQDNTSRQCCQKVRSDLSATLQKVTARRRHWGQGISPASGVLTSKRYACALTAGGGEGLSPANGGAVPKR